MDSISIYGNLRAAMDLFDKASTVMSLFKTYNPAIAPHELCRLYFLLVYLRDPKAQVFATPPDLERLDLLFARCTDLIQQYHQAQAGSRRSGPYTWPVTAENTLQSLINDIDDELLRLRFCVPSSDETTPIRRRNPDDDRGPTISLHSVHIAERDAISRTLQYRSADAKVSVSHRIIKGRFPSVEDKLDATQVNFDEAQELVIQTGDQDYKIYNDVYPQYDFANASDADDFISKVRERELLGKYLPDRIYVNGQTRKPLARCKVVRVWKRNAPLPLQAIGLQTRLEITMTFENTRDDKQHEFNLDAYDFPAELFPNDRTVEIRTRKYKPGSKDKPDTRSFEFQKTDGNCARRLRDHINEFHPLAPQSPRLSDVDARIWTTLASLDTPVSPGSNTSPEITAPGKSPGMISSNSGYSTSTNTFTLPPPARDMPPADPEDHTPDQGPTPLWFPTRTDSLRPQEERPAGSVASSTYEPSPSLRAFSEVPPEPKSSDDFKVAIVCAKSEESSAVEGAFDYQWENPDWDWLGDGYSYTYGCIGRHYVVLVQMAYQGKIDARGAASDCLHNFPSIKLCLVVGICGGVPDTGKRGIWLGDVVISEGVMQYDYGKRYPGGFVPRNSWNDAMPRLDNQLTSLLNTLKGDRKRRNLKNEAMRHLHAMQEDVDFGDSARYPRGATDTLFDSSYPHKHHDNQCAFCNPGSGATGDICEEAQETPCAVLCDDLQVKRRLPQGQDSREPDVHFGLYASGDLVMKSGKDRDILATKGVVAIEMEGAAVWAQFPKCLIIKGVCDYADSHKKKDFQDYAAATAAAYTKAFLKYWRG